MNTKLINLANEMIKEVGENNSISIENREAIKTYIGYFGAGIDNLINKFYDINKNISDHAGVPVLKQLIDKLEYYEVSLANSTACIMLKKGNKLIDHTFINKFHFDNFMTYEELEEESRKLVKRNNITEYAINFTQY